MDELFGFSTTNLMYILVVLLGVSLLSVVLVAIFNPIMFKVGVRNIPRRRAQTTLIVLGLMLSTIIISAAFTTGDTVDQSVTSEVYGLLGSVDETINERSVDEDAAFNDPGDFVVADRSFSQAESAALIDSIARDPNVDFVEPGYSDLAVAVNQEQRLSSPLFNLVGLDPARARDLPDIEEVGGGRVDLGDLASGEIYIDESAADELNVKKGETILLIARSQQRAFRVRAIVEDRWLAGAGGFSVRREGGVLPLAQVQEIFGTQDRLTFIAISNNGDGHAGLKLTEDVHASVEPQLRALEARRGPNLAVNDTKRIGVDLAETAGNLFATIFIAFGLFSIGAGVLLIFMIFVMLAAERKPEMGMARAVGTKRFDLVQTFLSEGMTYNVLAAAVGTGLGVVVAFGMTQVMAAIFRQFDISITTHVTLKSLLISYSLGVVLTFLTVTFSSWRVSYINIVRAIRDIPEPPAQKPLWGSRGFFRTLGSLIAKPGSWKSWGGRVALVVLGVVFIGTASPLFATLGGLCIVLAIFLTFRFGMLLFVGGVIALLVFVLADSHSAFVLLAALSLIPLGLALTVRSFGAPERLTYTLTGLVIIYIWEIDFSVGLVERVFGETTGDIELFFLSGVMVTVAATFLVVYNADMILAPLTRLGRWLGALLPSIKMAVAYPLANRARTGLTMAMFCLVVFALTMISAFNHNFNRLFISDRALGGYDVVVDENPTNP
ncbi:MAG TPA: FtsX-like permease family protein, partial [Dehalococcoidia bacterium]|nr:FtsX-like permease family protein [Dehalococcoidia bacterium]